MNAANIATMLSSAVIVLTGVGGLTWRIGRYFRVQADAVARSADATKANTAALSGLKGAVEHLGDSVQELDMRLSRVENRL